MGSRDPSRNATSPVENPPAEQDLQEDQDQEEGEEGNQEKIKKGWIRYLSAAKTRRKWVKGAALGLLFLCMGLGFAQGKKLIPRFIGNPNALPSDKGHKQDYYEEKIPSFLIPLPAEGENQAVMIRLSVIWDGLTSFRYHGLELPIRNRIYNHIMGVVKEENNLDEKTSLLESEMSKILRECLGLESLSVKIKEVKRI